MYQNHYGYLDCRQGVVGRYRQGPHHPVNTGDRQAVTETKGVPDGQKLRETSKTRDPGHGNCGHHLNYHPLSGV